MPEPTTPNRTTTVARIVLAIAILAAVVAAIVIAAGAAAADRLKLATEYALLIFLFFLSIIVLLSMISNRIDLSQLIEELSGGASMARFQLLLFTFVIGFTFLIVVACKCEFPNVPPNVLALLGVSASTYAVGKGLQVSSGDVGASSDSAQKTNDKKPGNQG